MSHWPLEPGLHLDVAQAPLAACGATRRGELAVAELIALYERMPNEKERNAKGPKRLARLAEMNPSTKMRAHFLGRHRTKNAQIHL